MEYTMSLLPCLVLFLYIFRFVFLLYCYLLLFVFFFFNDTATTEIYTLSLHDALSISCMSDTCATCRPPAVSEMSWRSEEHTSELQSRVDLVCRLLLEKKKKKQTAKHINTK